MDKKNVLNSKELAKLIIPSFALDNKNNNTSYINIPIDIVSLIESYFNLYTINDNEDINQIINIEEYLKNKKVWLEDFSKYISEEINHQRSQIDLKDGYINIKYQKEDLSHLKNINPQILNQLKDACNWIIAEKRRKKALSEMTITPIKVKEYKPKWQEVEDNIDYINLWKDICYYDVYKDMLDYNNYIEYLSDKYNTDKERILTKIDEVKSKAEKNIKKHHEMQKNYNPIFKNECEEEQIKTIIKNKRRRKEIKLKI